MTDVENNIDQLVSKGEYAKAVGCFLTIHEVIYSDNELRKELLNEHNGYYPFAYTAYRYALENQCAAKEAETYAREKFSDYSAYNGDYIPEPFVFQNIAILIYYANAEHPVQKGLVGCGVINEYEMINCCNLKEMLRKISNGHKKIITKFKNHNTKED